MNNLFLVCGLLLTLAAFPVFAQTETQINKKPLEDFALFSNDRIQKKEFDLNAQFSVELNTVLTQDGKFDTKKSRIGAKTGDSQIIEVVTEGLTAIGDSGMLKYLRNLEVENLLIKVKQDDKTLTIQFVSELPTESKARTLVSALKMGFSMSKQSIKDDDEKALVNASSATSDGKKFILNFAMPKEVYQEMLLRKLKAVEAKKQSAGNN